MSALYRTLLCLLFIFLSKGSMACGSEQCIAPNSVELGVAIGVGVKTNPLVDGDNIPLVILPDIAWYGEHAYFDNGELGYQWLNVDKVAVETFIKIDNERAYFSFFHPSNILLSSSSIAIPPTFGPATPDSGDTENLKEPQFDHLSIEDISKRKWALNAGIRGHYYLNQAELSLSVQQDISQVYKGQSVTFDYKRFWLINDIRLVTQAGINWKSAKLLNYYYGIDHTDTDQAEFWYQVNSGFEPYITINMQKPINDNWHWLANIGVRKLAKSMTNSPLVKEKHVGRVFLGVAYRF